MSRSTTSGPFTGGCACGAVRYRCDGEVEFAFHCHCRKCQRATGGGHASIFAVQRDETEISGEIKYYEQGSDNGAKTYTGFCPTCGSPLISKTARFPERLYWHVASLDDPSRFAPKFVVYEESAHAWDYIDPALSGPSK